MSILSPCTKTTHYFGSQLAWCYCGKVNRNETEKQFIVEEAYMEPPKPELIVTSLEWSKKLKEAGWPTNYEAAFFWAIHSDKANVIPASFLPMSATSDGEYIAAPTSEEILRRLPERVHTKSTGGESVDYLRIMKTPEGDLWRVFYKNDHRHGSASRRRKKTRFSFESTSLANASAEMWCYLSENNLLFPKS